VTLRSTAVELKLLLFILTSVVLSSVGQISMRKGMSSEAIQIALAPGNMIDAFLVVASNSYVLVGLAMYGLGAAVWLLVLAKVEVSYAYPFIGLAFVLTAVLGWLFFNEALGFIRIIGTACIIIGVILVSSS